MKLKYIIVIFFITSILSILSININAKANEYEDVIKVGVYESYPYYEIDDDGKVSGYYHDLLSLLQKEYNFKYEYVVCDFDEGLMKLKDGKIDIMFGITITSERLKDIIYNKVSIATEKFALFSNNSKSNKLSSIDEATIGLVDGSTSAQFMLRYFSSVGISGDYILAGNWADLERLFEEGEVDIIPHNISMEKEGYYKIHEFSGDQVYIAASKNNRDILDKMDQAIIDIRKQEKNTIDELYKEYFETKDELTLKEKIVYSVVCILIVLIFAFYILPYFKKVKTKKKIRINMRNENYLLQYQPIYNPRNRMIVGFESLLRLLDEEKKLIPPSEFVYEIEENNMLYEVSLWILDRVIKDYEEIKHCDCVKDKDFYISINISLNEIADKEFIREASERLAKSKLGPNKICLEIIERIKVENLSKVAKNLMHLKQAGFKIAIDDFGTEYSNLDLLLNLDTNIIKIDKCFVEGLDRDEIKNEVINFVSRIAEVKNKDIVLEGIENESEANAIKNMEKDMIYVQGYYYSKPLFKEEIIFI